jgi:hypothetical protein
LFDVFKGPHWTLLGYNARDGISARANLHIHRIGTEFADDGGHVKDAYGLADGEWVLVRPDGYVGAVMSSDELTALERYLPDVGW